MREGIAVQEEQPKPSDDGLDPVICGLWIRILQDGLEIIESVSISASAVQRYASSIPVGRQRTPQLQALQNWTERHSDDLKRMCDTFLPTRERFLWNEQAYRWELRNGIESQPAFVRQLSPVPRPWRVPPLAHGNSKLLHDLLAARGGDHGCLQVAERTLRHLKRLLGGEAPSVVAPAPNLTERQKYSNPQAILDLKQRTLSLTADPDYEMHFNGADALLLGVLLRAAPEELEWAEISRQRFELANQELREKRASDSRLKDDLRKETIKKAIRILNNRLGGLKGVLSTTSRGARWGRRISFEISQST